MEGQVTIRRFIIFAIIAIFAVAILFFIFKMRYGWYTTASQAAFLNAGFLICVSAIAALWAFFPTRLGIAALGITTIIFPWIIQPESFPAIDLPFAAYAAVPIFLLVFATYLRQHCEIKQKTPGHPPKETKRSG